MNFWNFVNTRYCFVHVEIITFWIITTQVLIYHIYTYINMRVHTHTRTHTHIYTHMQNQVFNENIRPNKDSGQTERNKLKYLHYLNKWLKNSRWRSSFSVKFHDSSQNYFKGFVYILNGCIRALVYSELLLQILLIRKQPLEILVKSWKISYEEFHS